MRIELAEVTRDNLRELCKLDAGDGGRHVPANVMSMAQAAVHPEAWPRAIIADGELVGFLMLEDGMQAEPPVAEYSLWRLMVDRKHQGRGIGRAAIERLIEHVRTRPGATELYLSVVPGNAGAEHPYESMGFRPIGEIDDGEIVMRLPL